MGFKRIIAKILVPEYLASKEELLAKHSAAVKSLVEARKSAKKWRERALCAETAWSILLDSAKNIAIKANGSDADTNLKFYM